MKERAATLVIVSVLVLVPALVTWYERDYRPAGYGAGLRVIDLTGVASRGTWTMDSVTNINYWWKDFSPATIHLELGETVLLRFHSADVYHQFYVPALNFGPVSVKPGSVQEIRLEASQPGAFEYFCTYMCGSCHFYMRGWIIITPRGEEPILPDLLSCPICIPDFGDPPKGDRIVLGGYLYRKMGCGTCHGFEGEGGIENYNYINGEIPSHDTTAAKIFLRTAEDAEALLDVIRRGEPVDEDSGASEIAGFPIVKARFTAAEELIRQGKNAAPLDMEGPLPPLQMPAWKYKLSDREIDAIMGYFVSLYDWDEVD